MNLKHFTLTDKYNMYIKNTEVVVFGKQVSEQSDLCSFFSDWGKD